MKVKEVIAELQKLDPELPVVVEADHGQTPMRATWAGESLVEDANQYTMESIHPDHEDEYESADKVALIQGY